MVRIHSGPPFLGASAGFLHRSFELLDARVFFEAVVASLVI